MVELILTGGLGNQMFEYAAAKALALRLNTELKIDLYALKKATTGTKRNFELDIFEINEQIISRYKNRFLVKAYPIIEKNRAFFLKVFGYFRDGSAIVYASGFEKLKGNVVLHGHFQNTKYFEEYEDTIRQSFSFKYQLDDKNLDLANKIKQTNSISIHIRRGDYLTNEQAKNNFAVCPIEYYQKAIAKIVNDIENPHFYIFSDDINWAKENLPLANISADYIDWNTGAESYKDMQLMSLCKNNILANSSFSWWAAWLNTNENKIVIAPNQWFANEKRNKDLVDFYPKDWTII